MEPASIKTMQLDAIKQLDELERDTEKLPESNKKIVIQEIIYILRHHIHSIYPQWLDAAIKQIKATIGELQENDNNKTTKPLTKE